MVLIKPFASREAKKAISCFHVVVYEGFIDKPLLVLISCSYLVSGTPQNRTLSRLSVTQARKQDHRLFQGLRVRTHSVCLSVFGPLPVSMQAPRSFSTHPLTNQHPTAYFSNSVCKQTLPSENHFQTGLWFSSGLPCPCVSSFLCLMA